MNLEIENKALKEKLKIYEESPFSEGYLGVLKQIETCNADLIQYPAGLRDEEDAKSFDRYDKYIKAIGDYYDKLEYLRGKMSPEEVKVVDTKAIKSKTFAIQQPIKKLNVNNSN